jgi:hypothetical protein
MGPVRCPETSFQNHPLALRNIPEDRRAHLLTGGNLKTRKDGPAVWMWDQELQVCNTTTPEGVRAATPVIHLCTNIISAFFAIFLPIRVMSSCVITEFIFKSYSNRRWNIYICDQSITWAVLSPGHRRIQRYPATSVFQWASVDVGVRSVEMYNIKDDFMHSEN